MLKNYIAAKLRCHAALYIGDGKLVHALNSNVGIVVTSMYIMPIIDVRRVA